ncbi:alpha-1,2-fucosyltransferase [Methylomonas sp. MgM2]
MIIQNIIGGLGNQMFQYAFAYAQSQNRNTTLKLDTTSFQNEELRKYMLNKYNINSQIASPAEISLLKYELESTLQRTIRNIKRLPRPFSSTYYQERCFEFDKGALKRTGDIYFNGYWQSEQYFCKYRNNLLHQFTLSRPINHKTKLYFDNISSCESISLHIRRGDYVYNTKTNNIHGTCSLAYYGDAISFISPRIENPFLFIFSDDLRWAKENLVIDSPVTFIELKHEDRDCDEMFLMSQCKHNIIANSSFSWWGAWLNQNPGKIVIAPKRWFRDTAISTDDLIPESWIRI